MENHLNFVRRVSGSADLRIVSAALNARITNAIFSLVNGNTQVSATELMNLPIPGDLNDPSLMGPAAALAEPQAPGDRQALAEEFERVLWRVYGLPDELAEFFLSP